MESRRSFFSKLPFIAGAIAMPTIPTSAYADNMVHYKYKGWTIWQWTGWKWSWQWSLICGQWCAKRDGEEVFIYCNAPGLKGGRYNRGNDFDVSGSNQLEYMASEVLKEDAKLKAYNKLISMIDDYESGKWRPTTWDKYTYVSTT